MRSRSLLVLVAVVLAIVAPVTYALWSSQDEGFAEVSYDVRRARRRARRGPILETT